MTEEMMKIPDRTPEISQEQIDKFFNILFSSSTHSDENGMLSIPANPDIDVAAAQAKIDELLAE